MRHAFAVVLIAGLLSVPALAQPTDWFDDFSAPQLGARWQKDVSRQGTMTLDPKRQLVVLGGKESVYNHLETDLPAEVTSVQVDMNNVSDPSASWAPSVILYWGPDKYARVMLSLHYGLRLELAPGEKIVPLHSRVRPVPDTWYRVRLGLQAETVTLVFEQPGTTLSETVEIERLPEWQGPCRLIIGKGYMPRGVANPDFDNDYGRGDRPVAVHIDNVVVGQPADLETRLAASIAAARVEGELDPQQIHTAFWPNALSEKTRDTMWFAEGAYQRVCLIYDNLDKTHSAKRVRMEVEASQHLAPQDLVAGTLDTKIQTEQANGLTRFTVEFPPSFVLPADFHGLNKRAGDQPGWFSWPRSVMMPPVFIHCRPSSQQAGVLRARLVSDGRQGPWNEVKAVVLPPVAPLRQVDPRHLGLSLWEGGWQGPETPATRLLQANMLKQYQQVGLKRLHLSYRSGRAVPEIARELGLHKNLTSWWDYSAQCPPDVTPLDEERASVPNQRYTNFCPEIIATGAGTYGRFLESLTARMKECQADGLMLDYECVPPQCFDDRCRLAFEHYTGLKDVNWPQDVKKEGRHYRRWIEFRCDQGARYVKVIGEAARRAKPGCALQAWVAGYDYNNTIESAQIDVSKAAKYLTEPEVPHYTLPDDYSDMWIKDGGIYTVEAGIKTVQDSLNVTNKPIVFCSSVTYPLGSATPWSDPQLLNAQMLAIIGQGARGLSFWGGHDDGSVDGRYLHMLAKWNAALGAAGPFLWDGKRDDAAVTIQGADGTVVRKYVWRLKDQTLVFIVNLGLEAQAARIPSLPKGAQARQLLSGQPVDLTQPVAVPALDAAMIVIGS
ncbi:MAG: hypothetical protein ACYC63_03770 [Armatimonadota bacterium]